MAARPVVTVFSENGAASGEMTLPAVMTAPIRPDIVSFVHTNMAKNNRQPYAVSKKAGHQTSAISWGTGRAVSRIPRVPGGGTQRSGQGAFGNMCRGGRMFAPTKIWRRWHRHININQKRYAVASAIAAVAVPALVMARGHRIADVPELPLVVEDSLQGVDKTRKAVEALKALGAAEDLDRARESKKLRAGKGKMRNRRYVMRRGPLVVYDTTDGIDKALRNLPGVETVCVDRLNLLQLAPGGHMGRFVVWTQSAFGKLDSIYGTYTDKSTEKARYVLPRPQVTNADITRIINSADVQAVLRDPRPEAQTRSFPRKRNPLKNKAAMTRLNPYAEAAKAAAAKHQADNKAARQAGIKERRARKSAGRAFYEKANREGDVTF
ncbi:unnamed protein product [Phaeothamnion confervicola]